MIRDTTMVLAFAPQPGAYQPEWRQPMPRLLGGLTAMVALVALALLLMACSYFNRQERRRLRDLEKGENGPEAKPPQVFEEKLLVIMAGEAKPTFLATPVEVRASKLMNEVTVSNCL